MNKRQQRFCLVNDYQLLTTISAVYSSSGQNAWNSNNKQQNFRVCKVYVSSFVLKVPRLCLFGCLVRLTCGWTRTIMPMLDSILCQSHNRYVVDKVAMGQVNLRELRFSPVSNTPTVLHTHLHLQVTRTFTRHANGRRLGNCNFFRISVSNE